MAKKTARVCVKINREACKGCGLCIAFCGRGGIVIEEGLNKSGVHPAKFKEGHVCNGCGNCAVVLSLIHI